MKETNSTLLAAIKERLDNLIGTNKEEHIEIMEGLKSLTQHVNHENEKMDARVSKLEDLELVGNTKVTTYKYVLSGVIGSFTFILSVLGILAYLHII